MRSLFRRKMQYIKITNQVDIVNRLKLEKLGFSTKRNDDNTIGQFGSGIKFAPISAVRKSIPFFFVGNDNKGGYCLSYVVKDDEGVESIYYQYQDYDKPSSFTVDAGLLSWETEFQIYREVIANAMDESKISGEPWTIDIVDEVPTVPAKDEFSVYIGMTDEIAEIHNNFDKYFSTNRDPIYTSADGKTKLYWPIDDTLRVYCKGVLVYSSEHYAKKYGASSKAPGFFDYEFNDVALNEERTVRSEYEMNNRIIKTIAELDDEHLINLMLSNMIAHDGRTEHYEFRNIPQYIWNSSAYSHSNHWLNSFEKNYDNGVMLPNGLVNFNIIQTVKSRGFSPVVIQNEALYEFLENAKLPTAHHLLGEKMVWDFSMGFQDYEGIVLANKILSDVYGESYSEKVTPILGTFAHSDEDATMLAFHVKMEDSNSIVEPKILINRRHASEAKVEELIATIVHEWDHFTTGLDDGDFNGRMFRNIADERIGNLIFRLWIATHK